MTLRITGDPLIASELFQALTTWTPALTSDGTQPNLGSGTNFVQSGVYQKIENMVDAWGALRFGNTGSSFGTGNYLVSLPVAASSLLTASGSFGAGHPIGTAVIRDESSASASRSCVLQLVSTTTAYLMTGSGSVAGQTTPFTWAAGDAIYYHAHYPFDIS